MDRQPTPEELEERQNLEDKLNLRQRKPITPIEWGIPYFPPEPWTKEERSI